MVKRVEPEMLQNLLRLAEAFRIATGKPTLRAVSRLAHGDPPMLDRLLNGNGSITIVKYDDTIAYLTDPNNWPAGSKIPRLTDPQHHQEIFHGTKTPTKRTRGKGEKGQKYDNQGRCESALSNRSKRVTSRIARKDRR